MHFLLEGAHSCLHRRGLVTYREFSGWALPMFSQNFLRSSEVVGSLRRKGLSLAREHRG